MEGRARALGVAEEADVRAFRQGVITEVVNPKTALFYVSFLPQFAQPEAGPLAVQLALLGVISVALSTSGDVLVALAAGKLGQRLMATPRLWRRQRKLSGGLLVGLGVYAAASDRTWRDAPANVTSLKRGTLRSPLTDSNRRPPLDDEERWIKRRCSPIAQSWRAIRCWHGFRDRRTRVGGGPLRPVNAEDMRCRSSVSEPTPSQLFGPLSRATTRSRFTRALRGCHLGSA
jgi:hypothetical protein